MTGKIPELNWKRRPKRNLASDEEALINKALEESKIDYMFFPTGSPDLNPVEECWRQTRENVTYVSHNSEEELLEDLENYWKKQLFIHECSVI